MALFRTLPTPIYVLLPRLMVEVYLVLAPDVNFFLNSRTGVQVYKFKFDLQPGSLTDQVAGEHQPSYKHP